MPLTYYNEIDPYAAQWLRNLIAAGHIAPGDVDERSIEDVRPADLEPYTQCHFFAGIGVWSHALRLAGWPDDRPVWTGSCPCQPFSSAGKQAGTTDERHLWPAWFWLIQQCRPDVVFGEQVEAAISHGWLDLVQSDLEGEGYACGAMGLPACGVGAPHIRQRLWFVADNSGKRQHGREGAAEQAGWRGAENHSPAGQLADHNGERRNREQIQLLTGRPQQTGVEAAGNGGAVKLGNTIIEGLEGLARDVDRGAGRPQQARPVTEAGKPGWLADPNDDRHAAGKSRSPRAPQEIQGVDRPREPSTRQSGGTGSALLERPGPTNGHWGAADWLHCRDGKWRPVEPGTFPLVNGTSARVGRLRAYGNAIVPQVAAEFIKAYQWVRGFDLV